MAHSEEKEAVYLVVLSIVKTIETDRPVVLTLQQIQDAANQLFDMKRAGKARRLKFEVVTDEDGEEQIVRAGYEDDSDWSDKNLTGYCRGLVKCWLKKDSRLNGGVAYVPSFMKGEE